MRSERYGGERGVVAGRQYTIWGRCRIQGLNSVFPDGTPDFTRATWTESVDSRAAEGEILFALGQGINSKSPLMSQSNYNTSYNDGVRAPFWPGGFFVLEAATMPKGSTPSGSDWRSMWEGRIDRVDPAKNPGFLTLRCRDRGAYLLNSTIQNPFKAGGNQLAEQVMLDIIAANYAGFAAGELYVPQSSGFAIPDYAQGEMQLMQALEAIALNRGWDLRYRYESDGGPDFSKLTFYDPGRDAGPIFQIEANQWLYPTMTDIGPSEYKTISEFDINDDEVRNIIEVWYAERLLARVADPFSQAFYGDRFMRLAEALSSHINTEEEGMTLANLALTDLKDPFATHSITLPFWPFVQLNDVYNFKANNVHYDRDQVLAVSQFTHTLTPGSGETQMMGRGRPLAAYSAWMDGTPPSVIRSLNPPVGIAPEGTIWIKLPSRDFPA